MSSSSSSILFSKDKRSSNVQYHYQHCSAAVGKYKGISNLYKAGPVRVMYYGCGLNNYHRYLIINGGGGL